MKVSMADNTVFWRDLSQPPVELVEGQGVYLFDRKGRRYLDAASGAAVSAIGHGNEEVAEAMAEQAKKLDFAHMSKFYSRSLVDLTDRLVGISPPEIARAHPVSGGSEANETAVKLARVFQIQRGKPRKYKVISRASSYHGATLGVLALSGKTKRQEAYAPLMRSNQKIAPAYCYRCPYGKSPSTCSLECADDLERAIVQEGEDTVAAFIAEPVSGSSAPGVHPPDGYWERVRGICDEYGVLLIVDEVMSGLGRTGRWWGIDHSGVVPEIITAAKGVGAGYSPLGAVLIHEKIYEVMEETGGKLNHGFTYGGNPISAAAGAKVIDVMRRDGLVGRAAEMGEILLKRLKESIGDHPQVGEIRGRGLLIGVEFVRDRGAREPFAEEDGVPGRIRSACMDYGVYIYPGGSTVNGTRTSQILLAPPFIIAEEGIDELIDGLTLGVEEVLG